MQIRSATVNDLGKIAQTHVDCFPNSFSTALGVPLLKKFYLQYLKEYPDLFLVAVDDDRVAGFCMGYLVDGGNCIHSFAKHNIASLGFRYFLLLIKGNKNAWKRLKPSNSRKTSARILNWAFHNIPPTECVEENWKKRMLFNSCKREFPWHSFL